MKVELFPIETTELQKQVTNYQEYKELRNGALLEKSNISKQKCTNNSTWKV